VAGGESTNRYAGELNIEVRISDQNKPKIADKSSNIAVEHFKGIQRKAYLEKFKIAGEKMKL
jgi:hypothetical protein